MPASQDAIALKPKTLDFVQAASVPTVCVTQAAARYLSSGGRLVLTSSVSARIAVFHHTLYAASKAAVSAMVLNLASLLTVACSKASPPGRRRCRYDKCKQGGDEHSPIPQSQRIVVYICCSY